MSVKIFYRKFPMLYNNLKKKFFNMHTDRKTEDQVNATEDLKGVVGCRVGEHNCCHYCQWWPESKCG